MKYSPIERICLELIFTAKKLRHYMLSHTINLVSKIDPLKYKMSRPILSGRIGKWALLLKTFPMKKFYSSKSYHHGGYTSTGQPEVMVLKQEEMFNNVAEYQALVIGLETTLDMDIHQLEAFGDSKFIINQLLAKYEVRNSDLNPYHKHVAMLMRRIDSIKIKFIPRSENREADALANLAIILARSDEEFSHSISIAQRWVLPSLLPSNLEENNSVEVVEDEDREDWRQPIINFLQHQKLTDNPQQKTEIKRRASRFIFYKGKLYRQSFDGVFLRCLSNDEATQVVEEAHSGICGAHQSRPKLHFRIKRMGYYWPTMGLDVIRPITPKSSIGHAYILVGIDYFSKWAEAIPLKEVKKENVADFIRIQIIYQYSVPRHIITDNGKPFCNSHINNLCAKFGFKQYNLSMYNAAANGLTMVFNKTLCNLLNKVVSKAKKDWHEKISEVLWAYRTTYRTPTQAPPYVLVYGVEAVFLLECQISSL
ncbi:uncharacterized protein LOC111398097 [Olea europaea var. sylvestris]|uniref:uncharacterized protein LOC111398097 n=1 Tax=Olea europaea var. sylvestris TaxID=158386 RepID=UPI000C1D1BE3|nr:uncharacterized protein LOC111398097 [Olea europaea var. sylvestris]